MRDRVGRNRFRGLDANDPTVDWSFLSSLPPSLTFTRASAATYIDGAGVLQSAAINAPRFDCDPMTHEPRGLLMEDQRTNELTYSSDFTNAVWTRSGITVTADRAVSPAGDMTADRIRIVSGYIYQTKNWGAAKHTFSVYAKAVSGTSKFRLNYYDGTTNYNSADFTATSAWQRFQFTVDTTAVPANFAIVNASDGSVVDIYAWGGQVEESAFATSYIPTTNASVTRAADSLYTTNIPWFNPNAGTMAVEYDVLPGQGTSLGNLMCFSDGTFSNIIDLLRSVVNNTEISVRKGGSGNTPQSISGPVYADGRVNKSAASWGATTQTSAVNGNLGGTQAITTGLPTVNQLAIGMRGDGAERTNGHIRRVRYWNTEKPRTFLQQVTQ